eukprot:gnl/MRDRNA2_/MRDRNA2_120289_c0_seq1.p1 gnl/MRDRNA2_/MRDRNA2_120289_c0~~gnl/MRDRNA2_/MRDRNA2_120289_c0_seq1.p1  ORF type:complete len:700 (+),score=129.88 gnl/MRDRNA2_/MRDRNA2_120289_c0_seq1:144-2243(+)
MCGRALIILVSFMTRGITKVVWEPYSRRNQDLMDRFVTRLVNKLVEIAQDMAEATQDQEFSNFGEAEFSSLLGGLMPGTRITGNSGIRAKPIKESTGEEKAAPLLSNEAQIEEHSTGKLDGRWTTQDGMEKIRISGSWIYWVVDGSKSKLEWTAHDKIKFSMEGIQYRGTVAQSGDHIGWNDGDAWLKQRDKSQKTTGPREVRRQGDEETMQGEKEKSKQGDDKRTRQGDTDASFLDLMGEFEKIAKIADKKAKTGGDEKISVPSKPDSGGDLKSKQATSSGKDVGSKLDTSIDGASHGEDNWVCPKCGRMPFAQWHFQSDSCFNCGAPKPVQTAAAEAAKKAANEVSETRLIRKLKRDDDLASSREFPGHGEKWGHFDEKGNRDKSGDRYEDVLRDIANENKNTKEPRYHDSNSNFGRKQNDYPQERNRDGNRDRNADVTQYRDRDRDKNMDEPRRYEGNGNFGRQRGDYGGDRERNRDSNQDRNIDVPRSRDRNRDNSMDEPRSYEGNGNAGGKQWQLLSKAMGDCVGDREKERERIRHYPHERNRDSTQNRDTDAPRNRDSNWGRNQNEPRRHPGNFGGQGSNGHKKEGYVGGPRSEYGGATRPSSNLRASFRSMPRRSLSPPQDYPEFRGANTKETKKYEKKHGGSDQEKDQRKHKDEKDKQKKKSKKKRKEAQSSESSSSSDSSAKGRRRRRRQ